MPVCHSGDHGNSNIREVIPIPYKTNADLPDGVKDNLPSEAQTVYRNVFNENEDKGESSAAKIAWTAVKNGWEKGEDGKWHRKVEKADWEIPVQIRKTEEDRQLVFGWLSVAADKDGTPIVDGQGDIIEIEELEDAMYQYMLDARGVGEMHEKFEGIGRPVEMMVFTKAKCQALGIPEGTLPEGAWIGYKIDNADTWAKIKSGEYRAFSIGGSGVREGVSGDAD